MPGFIHEAGDITRPIAMLITACCFSTVCDKFRWNVPEADDVPDPLGNIPLVRALDRARTAVPARIRGKVQGGHQILGLDQISVPVKIHVGSH